MSAQNVSTKFLAVFDRYHNYDDSTVTFLGIFTEEEFEKIHQNLHKDLSVLSEEVNDGVKKIKYDRSKIPIWRQISETMIITTSLNESIEKRVFWNLQL